MDLRQLLKEKRKRTRTVYVMLDDGLITERDRLVNEHLIAVKQDQWANRPEEAPGLRDQIREVEALIEKSRIPVTFQAMPRTRWTELIDAYTLDDGTGEIDVEGFGPEIIAASWVNGDGNLATKIEDVREMWGTWSAAETEQLYIAAYRVNREIRDIPFTSPDIDETQSSDLNSTTAPPEE